VPAARAGAKKINLAIVIGLRAHPLHGGFGIADHLGIGNAAFGTYLGGNIVRITLASSTLSLVEVGADREITVVREPTRRLDVEFTPAWQMVDKRDARKGARPDGLAT
jgi:hypothetical protein